MLEICARMELVPILAMVCGVCVTKDTSWDQTARAPVSDKSNMHIQVHIQVHLAGRTIRKRLSGNNWGSPFAFVMKFDTIHL